MLKDDGNQQNTHSDSLTYISWTSSTSTANWKRSTFHVECGTVASSPCYGMCKSIDNWNQYNTYNELANNSKSRIVIDCLENNKSNRFNEANAIWVIQIQKQQHNNSGNQNTIAWQRYLNFIRGFFLCWCVAVVVAAAVDVSYVFNGFENSYCTIQIAIFSSKLNLCGLDKYTYSICYFLFSSLGNLIHIRLYWTSAN